MTFAISVKINSDKVAKEGYEIDALMKNKPIIPLLNNKGKLNEFEVSLCRTSSMNNEA